MNQNNNNIRSIYIKCTRTYNKNLKNNYLKNNEKKEESMIEKNNIIFINNVNEKKSSKEILKPIPKSRPNPIYQNNNDDIYLNKNEKKKNKVVNGNMNIFLDNIKKDDNIMTIHNINLINSMNNITFYDSITNLKKDIIKSPSNKFNSHKYNKNNNNTHNNLLKNNCSMDFKINNNKKQKNNILVNKRKILMENKNIINNNIGYNLNNNFNNNRYKNNSLSKKKNPFKELNYKKLNLLGENKSFAQIIKGNNYSNFNTQGNRNYKNLYQNTEFVSNRDACLGDLSQSKNANNSLNKVLTNENTTNKNDLSIYNTCSNYTSSINEEEITGNKNNIFFDKKNHKNVINVNKLESFKMNDTLKNNNGINCKNITFLNNYRNPDNCNNNKISSNTSSNIISLLSNKNIDNYNKSRLDIENLNKIKKNINNEKLYKAKSKDKFNNKMKTEKNKNSKKTKSEEKIKTNNKDNKNVDNKEIIKCKKKYSSNYLSENNTINNKNRFTKNELGNIYLNDIYNYGNSITTHNASSTKFFYSTFNSKNNQNSLFQIQKKKSLVYPNKLNNNNDINAIPKSINMNISVNDDKDIDNCNDNKDNNIFEKIEVNKKNFPKISLSKNNIKSKSKSKKNSNNYLETRNDSLNIYAKKTYQDSWINNSELINSFNKNFENYCYLSNYKEKKKERKYKNEEINRKKSAPKKNISNIPNIIYNKKPLLSNKKKEKEQQNKEDKEDNDLSSNSKIKKLDNKESDSENCDKKCITDDFTDNSKIKKDNYEEECINSYNNNNIINENDIVEDINENINKGINVINKTYSIKSPTSTSTIYKKPGIVCINNSNSLIANGKDSFNNKISIYQSKIIENENNNEKNNKENLLKNSKKKNRKIYLNIKLNRFLDSKLLTTTDNYDKNNNIFKKGKINININNINYDKREESPKFKDNLLVQSIKSYKPIKNNIINNENNISKDYIINTEQFSVTKINKKVSCPNCFSSKYCCYFIPYNYKDNSFISKIRYNKNNLTFYEIPIKKVCYFSKNRKILGKFLPKIEICYFKKDLIKNKNKNYNIKIINPNNNIDDENAIINNENDLNRKNQQYSFASINSNENGSNYFEISFGKKMNKSFINFNNENVKKNLNNHDINNLNKFNSPEKKNGEENKNNNIVQNKKIFVNNIIDISPSKLNLGVQKYNKNNNYKNNYKNNNKNINNKNNNNMKNYYYNKNNINNNNNDIYLKKAEKGLKLLEKIAGNRISPISNKKKNLFLINNNNNKDTNEKIKINNDKNNIKRADTNKNKSNNNLYTNIKYDYLELLNMITINNYDSILNKISDIILNNNMVTIDNISQLLKNQNEFIEVIINKSMKDKKYIKIYAKLCKDLFISLMSIIDNYNDDIDIFDKITKDKSLKVILKNRILEKINQLNFVPEPTFGKLDKNNAQKDPFYLELKFNFTYLIYFIGELLEIKLISLKSGFEILDILYKKYIKDNNNTNILIYNDLYLEGIEILLNKMKIIIYVKNNLEHIQRYNKFIKNYLNNIFIKREKRNDLPKYLYYKLYNLIEAQKTEEEIKEKEKVKTYVKSKEKINKDTNTKLNEFSRNVKNDYIKVNSNNNKNNSFTILEEKYNVINTDINKGVINKKDILFKKENIMMNVIKKDVEKFIFELNINQINYELLKEINKRYNEEFNVKKSIDIWEIFYYYIEACIDLINSEDKVYIANEYIENIINNFAIDIPNESWEMLHYKLISLYLNINEICTDNIYMHQVMGFLLYLLINNKLFFIKDLNNFLNKDNEIIINISKVVKYTIIFADKDAKKFHNDFKQTKLFIGNDIFYNIVTKPLSKKYL